MQIVRELVDAILGLFRWAVDFVEPLVQNLTTAFGLDLSETAIQFLSVLVVALPVVAVLYRQVYWPIVNASMFRPQKITLTTSETPWQVVTKDLSGCVVVVLVVVVVFLILYSLR